MKKLGLRAKDKKKFKVTTDSKHNLPAKEKTELYRDYYFYCLIVTTQGYSALVVIVFITLGLVASVVVTYIPTDMQ